MKRLRVLVCGTNYGRIYRAAIQRAPQAFELVGILARGSARSLELSKESGVPLYREVESLPGDIDIACAAMGTSGEGVVLRLLEHGIHVLCEHPHGPDFMEAAKRTAAQHHACFHVNGHFAGLEAASAFIKHCNLARRFAVPVFLDAMATDRSLYGALDILRRTTTTFEPAEFLVRDHGGPFTLVTASVGGVSGDSPDSGFRDERSNGPQGRRSPVHRGLSPRGGFSPRCSQHALDSWPSDLEQQPFPLVREEPPIVDVHMPETRERFGFVPTKGEGKSHGRSLFGQKHTRPHRAAGAEPSAHIRGESCLGENHCLDPTAD